MLIAALLLAALPAAAHLYPIAPARVTLSLEPERLVADVRADSIYWIEEVLQIHPLPLSGWSGETRARAEAYVNARLRLRADGAPLTGRLVAASYVQRPWQINEQGEVRLRLAYPPPPPGAALAGEADFYEEYRQEMLEHLKGKPFPKNQEFATVVRVRGAGRRFALRPGSVSFSLRADEARPPFWGRPRPGPPCWPWAWLWARPGGPRPSRPRSRPSRARRWPPAAPRRRRRLG
ncbi:MAG: hypothetical protein HY552_01910 [Elusimicrobia bacterium]|nr:hypothetical protein [Elusimicrobiota bacterium]